MANMNQAAKRFLEQKAKRHTDYVNDAFNRIDLNSINKHHGTATGPKEEGYQGKGYQGTGLKSDADNTLRKENEANAPKVTRAEDLKEAQNTKQKIKDTAAKRDKTLKSNVNKRKKLTDKLKESGKGDDLADFRAGKATGTMSFITNLFNTTKPGQQRKLNKDTMEIEIIPPKDDRPGTALKGRYKEAFMMAIGLPVKDSKSIDKDKLAIVADDIKHTLQYLKSLPKEDLTPLERHFLLTEKVLKGAAKTKAQDTDVRSEAKAAREGSKEATATINEINKEQAAYDKRTTPWKNVAKAKVRKLQDGTYSIKYSGDVSEASGEYRGVIRIGDDNKRYLDMYYTDAQSKSVVDKRRSDFTKEHAKLKEQIANLKDAQADRRKELKKLHADFDKIKFNKNVTPEERRELYNKIINAKREYDEARAELLRLQKESGEVWSTKNETIAGLKRTPDVYSDAAIQGLELPDGDITEKDIEDAANRVSPKATQTGRTTKAATARVYGEEFKTVAENLLNDNDWNLADYFSKFKKTPDIAYQLVKNGYDIDIHGNVYGPEDRKPKVFIKYPGIYPEAVEADRSFRTPAVKTDDQGNVIKTVLTPDDPNAARAKLDPRLKRPNETNEQYAERMKRIMPIQLKSSDQIAQEDAKKYASELSNIDKALTSGRFKPGMLANPNTAEYDKLMTGERKVSEGLKNILQGRLPEEISNALRDSQADAYSDDYTNASLADLIAQQQADRASDEYINNTVPGSVSLTELQNSEDSDDNEYGFDDYASDQAKLASRKPFQDVNG